MKPMLCKDDLEEFFRYVTDNSFHVYESLKLDGVRCLSTVWRETGDVLHFSRSGKPFPNFDCFNEGLRAAAMCLFVGNNFPYVVFDSEVTSSDVKFTNVMQQLRRIKNLDYSIFRMHLLDIASVPSVAFWQRQELLKSVRGVIPEIITIHSHQYVRHFTMTLAKERLKEVLEQGHEGLVYKVGYSVYTPGKSINWLKMKGVQTLDLKVIGSKPGKGKYEGILGAIICDYNGVEVAVSGMTDEQRKEFTKELPKLIEVEFQGFTSKGSLRHPRFVRVRDDKEESDS